jgi:hypothetical protein
MDFNLMRIVDTFRSEFHRREEDVHTPSNAFYLHFRGGDVFKVGPSPYYGQPPCTYNADAIGFDRNISQIILVSEDIKNPCVSETPE